MVYSEKVVKFRQPEWPFPFGEDPFHWFFGPQQPRSQNQPRFREYRVPERMPC